MVADGLHARTDGFTSLAVLVGAGGVASGWSWADPAVGLLITVAIVGVLRSAVVQVGARLMDAVDPVMVARARTLLADLPQVSEVRSIRLRWVGHSLHAEADICTSADQSLRISHRLAHEAETVLMREMRRLGSATVHVGPAGGHDGEKVR